MPTFMSLTARQKRAFGRELRDTLFRLCSAGGLFVGLLWDIHNHLSVQRPSRATCSVHGVGHAAISRIGHCIGNELTGIVVSWLIPIGVGLLLGALVGALLATTIRLGRSPGRP